METPGELLQEIEEGAPGKRFQRLYRKRQQSAHGGLKNGAFVIGGLVVIAIGVVTYPIPVIPSEIVILAGIALLAQGWSVGARALDAAELWVRRRFGWLIEKWKRLPKAAKIALWIVWIAAISGLSYGVYRAFK